MVPQFSSDSSSGMPVVPATISDSEDRGTIYTVTTSGREIGLG